MRDGHADLVAMIQRAQLFQCLDLFDGRRGEFAEGMQETGAIGIDADMAQYGNIVRQRLALCIRIARPGDRCAAEIQRVAVLIQYRLDDVRVAHRRLVVDGMAGGGDGALRVVVQVLRHSADERRRDQWFIALYVDHDGFVRPALLRGDFCDAIGAAGMVGARHAGIVSVLLCGGDDGLMVGGDDDLLCAALSCLFRNAYHHRLAADVQQRFSGQAGGGEAGGDDDFEIQHYL